VVSAGWWVVVVSLWPASARPYIGSTSDNSIVSLVFGYNGLSRLFGQGAGAGGAAGGGAGATGVGGGSVGFGGAAGWLRMLNLANGGQVAWFIPLALCGLAAGLWLTRRAPRTDRTRAGWMLWGGWALVTAAVFSRAAGVFHPYYSVQLAPALAALAGAGVVALWRLGRRHRHLRWTLPAAVVLSGAWAVALLLRTPTYLSWLRPLIVIGCAAAAVGLVLGSQLRHRGLVLTAAGVAAVTLLSGPAAFAVTTVRTPATGSIVFAGPQSGDGTGGGAGGGAGVGGSMGADGGVDDALITYLEANRGSATYLVATFGSQSSSPIIIATGEPVVTIGGFNGGDGAPTLAQFRQMVAAGEIRFVLVSGGGSGGGPGGGTGSSISSWVTTNGHEVPASTYGGTGSSGTLYDLAGLT
jgi:4-amino-4-deoxy-L-arabinose transferase-like glycosyltransferase